MSHQHLGRILPTAIKCVFMPLGIPTVAHHSVPCWFSRRLPSNTGLHTTSVRLHQEVAVKINSASQPVGSAPLARAQLTRCSAAVSPPAPDSAGSRPRLAIFVSGGGSNFRCIHAAIQEGHINADVAVVVSDMPGCGGWEYAAAHGIPTEVYTGSAGKGLSTEALVAALKQRHAVDFVLLAGYLKLIPEELVRAYKRAMLNIHPALLPAFGGKGFYGTRVHRAVIASGARFSGPTIHFVDEGYDTGPILAQAVVPVSPTDTPKQLAARVLKEEHRLYPQAVAALVNGRVNWRADGIPVMWTAH